MVRLHCWHYGNSESDPMHHLASNIASELWVPYNWWSNYSSPNSSDKLAVDEAWAAVIPAHGIVAVEQQWAAQRQLPPSISLPSDASKSVYIIDAYHQLHCLVGEPILT